MTSSSGPDAVHPLAKCCWCQKALVRMLGFWWCQTSDCRRRQRAHGMQQTRQKRWLYVPTPKQVEFDACETKYVLYGGAAGPGKSHAARWALYRKCRKFDALGVPFEALLLRRTFPELEKTHLRRMAQEASLVGATFTESKRLMRWPHGSLIECGHMEDQAAVQKYLSTEYDAIVPDEGATFEPLSLLELSTRARTSKRAIQDAGGAKFWVVSNPGGPSSSILLDLFVDHTPNFEQFPALERIYHPEEWTFIPATLDDNPYIDPHYEQQLAVLPKWRYDQLRHGDWRVFVGQFFSEWQTDLHVRSLEPGSDVQWFRSLDWGRNQPGCVLWWAVLSDHQLYIRREYKFQNLSEHEVAQAVRDIDVELGLTKVLYTAADPSIFNKTGATHERAQFVGQSIGESLNYYGLQCIRGDNDRFNGWGRCHALLRQAASGEPWLTMHPDCRYLIRTIANAISNEKDPDDVDTHTDDHALDAWRYGAMSRPQVGTKQTSRQRFAEGTMGALRQSVGRSKRRLLGSESTHA